MTTDTLRRKRLLYRCHYCGTRENDILVGQFAQKHVPRMPEVELDQFETLLDSCDDVTLYQWLAGLKPVPENLQNHPILIKMIDFAKNLESN